MNKEIRLNFPFMEKGTIYFDNASTALRPKCVMESIAKYCTYNTANAYRGSYENSEYVSGKIDECRELTALFLNCSSSEIIFTSNCTDSVNQLVHMLGVTKEDNIVCSVLEHHSNLLPWVKNANVFIVDVDEEGAIDLAKLEEVLDNKQVRIVSVTALSNVTGNFQPIKKVCEIAHKYGALVILDCCQYVPHGRINVKEIGCDFLVFSGHKLGSPCGVGVIYGKKELLLRCSKAKYGGGMVDRIIDFDNILYKEVPYCFEAGTPPIESIIGLGSALKFIIGLGIDNIEARNQELEQYFRSKIENSKKVEMIFPIRKEKEHAPIFTFKIRDKDINMSYYAKLLSDSADICVSSGYQCCQPLYQRYNCKGGIRVSLQYYNSISEIDNFFDVIDNLKI